MTARPGAIDTSPLNRRARVTPRELAGWLIERGQHWIALAEAADLLGVSAASAVPMLARLRAKGELFSPNRGVYVPVPLEFRSWGALPATHFIDQYMRSFNHPYYVGLLSAAEILGVAHQHPQVFQVITTGRLQDRNFGRVRVQFVVSRHAAVRPTRQVNTPTGTIRVATPEVTALDLVGAPEHSGGISNVATVLREMVEEGIIDPVEVARTSSTYPIAVCQRTGWLLQQAAADAGVDIDMVPLHTSTATRKAPALLDPAVPRRGGVYDQAWNLIINVALEPDL